MLEAMATGTPVAAYPVDGPLEVLGSSTATNLGGVMHENLLHAAQQALLSPRQHARDRAIAFSWGHAAKLFESHLVLAAKNPIFATSQDAHNSFKPVESR